MENRNIVVLGASFGGLSISHYLAKHIMPTLQQNKDAKYALHIVDPSTHFWWHIAAPREIVSVKDMTHEKCFVPSMAGFKQYPQLKDSIIFHHGSASGLDTDARTVSIDKHEGGAETLEYYALVIATGVRSPTPLTTLQGDYTISQKALEDVNGKLASAKDIVISGGGPVGVETCGEIAVRYGAQAKVTLIAGSDKLLPVLRRSLAAKAQKLLEKNGVTVLYNTKVTSSTDRPGGRTEIVLDNGSTLTADVYIPAFGVKPNTDFLPDALKSPTTGYITTNPHTLRIDAAGPRVYAAGDITGLDNGGVLKMYETIPVLGANMAHDLLGRGAEKRYTAKESETQLVPMGPKTGVGAFNGFSMPGFAVGLIKGKDYMLKEMGKITEGRQYVKA